ncbi:MAG: hypothetical protein Q8K58_04130 [Acidimicrobiales bacterium]|nr:hypothetical protein [Acidimicrobiales bacterium]
MADEVPGRADAVAAANRLIEYHGPISKALTQERTSLESALIPVTAYIVVACAEAFLRYPEMMRRIDAAMPAEEIGRRARRPGCQVNTCYLWSISNFFLLGRKIMGMVHPGADDPVDTAYVLDFWERAALAYRGDDGTRQAWDTGTATPYDTPTVEALLAGVRPIEDDEHRARVKRFGATLVNHLFLLYFDTRAGYGDTGPYPVPGQPGRTLLVRDFYRLAEGDFPWSSVARDVPYHHLTAAMVLEDVQTTITDFGTSNHVPEDYLDHLVGFALSTTDGLPPGELRLVPPEEHDPIVAAVRKAQGQHYRNIAAMDRDEKIRAGAYVYFTFLRPFAELAGVADELDWSVPRDLPEPVYQLVSAMQGENAGVPEDEAYYEPYYKPSSATTG